MKPVEELTDEELHSLGWEFHEGTSETGDVPVWCRDGKCQDERPSLEELRIEIAEFCGWTKIYQKEQEFEVDEILWGINPKLNVNRPIPNYPSSLDAMWEAEERLDNNFIMGAKSEWERFKMNLSWEIYKTSQLKGCIHATAKQRAIAFVKTIREIKSK